MMGDVWSFGCCLLYLISKTDLIPPGSQIQAIPNVQRLSEIEVRRRCDSLNINPTIKKIIKGCLEIDQKNRMTFDQIGGMLKQLQKEQEELKRMRIAQTHLLA